MRKKVELGDEVIDPVTKIKGIAYARLEYLQGCDRIGIQTPTIWAKDSAPEVPELFHVDEPQLNIVKRGKIARPNQKKGGGPPGGPSFFGPSGKR